jgi:hypothetical protein
MSQWQAKVTKENNPLTILSGQPIISEAGPGSQYLGRVIIELWDNSDHPDKTGSATLAYQVDPGANGPLNQIELLDRASSAFPARFARDRSSMNDS